VLTTDPGVDVLLPQVTRFSRVYPSEVIAWPKAVLPDLDFSTFGRRLLPTDRVAFEAEGLGTLVALVV
jgi:hypothetical protein